MQVIPAIDVLDGGVVRLRQGDYGDVTRFGDDPVAVIRAFSDDGADLVHVVDLAAARTGRPSPDLWTSIGTVGTPFQAAGGIRGFAAGLDALTAGAARVVTGTTAVWDRDGLEALVSAAGCRLVAAIDVKDGKAVGAGWTDDGRALDDVLERVENAGVARLMVTAIATDGMLTGPDLALLRRVIARVEVPVIASGGVGSLDDLRAIRDAGAEAAVIGRALYDDLFTLQEAMDAAN